MSGTAKVQHHLSSLLLSTSSQTLSLLEARSLSKAWLLVWKAETDAGWSVAEEKVGKGDCGVRQCTGSAVGKRPDRCIAKPWGGDGHDS
jgi:hypothetical protein